MNEPTPDAPCTRQVHVATTEGVVQMTAAPHTEA
jgi:hypothetical protein